MRNKVMKSLLAIHIIFESYRISKKLISKIRGKICDLSQARTHDLGNCSTHTWYINVENNLAHKKMYGRKPLFQVIREQCLKNLNYSQKLGAEFVIFHRQELKI